MHFNNHRFIIDQSIIKSPTANTLLHVPPGLTLKKYMTYPFIFCMIPCTSLSNWFL